MHGKSVVAILSYIDYDTQPTLTLETTVQHCQMSRTAALLLNNCEAIDAAVHSTCSATLNDSACLAPA